MSARQDFLDAINHREPRRIPVDFGSTAVTGIPPVRCVARCGSISACRSTLCAGGALPDAGGDRVKPGPGPWDLRSGGNWADEHVRL